MQSNERVEVVEGALEDPHQPRGGRGIGVEDVREERGELLDLSLHYLDPVRNFRPLRERQGVQPEGDELGVDERDPSSFRLGSRADQVERRVSVRVDEDESNVLPLEEPQYPVEQSVGLPGPGRADVEGVEEHVLSADCVLCHRMTSVRAL